MTLSEWSVKCSKYRKDVEAWTENSARVYNLVLTRCPSELESEMQNHSTWAANTTKQDCIEIVVMIRDLTHNTKETKQGTTALVECHANLYTTVQKPNNSIEDFKNLHGAKRQSKLRPSSRHCPHLRFSM